MSYLSPGVYVEEVPSAVKAIAGVSTSTAGFIGVCGDSITIPLTPTKIVNGDIATGDGATTVFDLPADSYPVDTTAGTYVIRVDGAAVSDAILSDVAGVFKVTFTTAPASGAEITGDYLAKLEETFSPVAAGEAKLCTTFADFKKYFGDFSSDPDQNKLAHAVYGFFNNGGSRCYVVREATEADILNNHVVSKFEAIDEIAMVAAPGLTGTTIWSEIVTHCQVKTQDRFAIFDSPETLAGDDLTLLDYSNSSNVLPYKSDYAAFYFPWIQVYDPVTKILNPDGDGLKYVPPSGHIAGIYARADSQRGVHKAPANEAVFGALGLKYSISKAQQDGLNPQGVNCIRNMNGNNFVWGARTIGGDSNADLKYINVRRTLLFLRESIDEGTQWVVFEPNTAALWQKITRNVTAFLTNVWRSGALFGTTAQEAFYVKCDAETNPPELRELGQVVTEIGVAIVRPAEFVIFRISQWTPSK